MQRDTALMSTWIAIILVLMIRASLLLFSQSFDFTSHGRAIASILLPSIQGIRTPHPIDDLSLLPKEPEVFN
jgi:hypothetical protein